MTNEEKYRDIAENNCRYYGGEYDSFKECFISAKEAADWKEQQMIEKAVEWLEHSFCDAVADNLHIVATYDFESVEQMIKDFKKTMKGD